MAAYPFWTRRADWPQRYEVRLLVGDEARTAEYRVTTWLGEAKAIAIASAVHVSRSGSHVGIHDVAVDCLGPVEAAADGSPERLPGHLVDHFETRV